MLPIAILALFWHPIRDLSLFRALATGSRIPGTNLIIMPLSSNQSRFGTMERVMIALAGSWVLFRVIFSELAEEDKLHIEEYNNSSSVTDIIKISNDKPTTDEQDNDSKARSENNNNILLDNELFFYDNENIDEDPPELRFTQDQLKNLLQPGKYEDHVYSDENGYYNKDGANETSEVD